MVEEEPEEAPAAGEKKKKSKKRKQAEEGAEASEAPEEGTKKVLSSSCQSSTRTRLQATGKRDRPLKSSAC